MSGYPICGHSACRQNYIDTGATACVQDPQRIELLAARVCGMTPGMGRVELQLPGDVPDWADLGHPVTIATPAVVTELSAERDRLQARLDTNRCNSGHETLALALWDCPECHNETKRRLADLSARANAVQAYFNPQRLRDDSEGRALILALYGALDRAGGAS